MQRGTTTATATAVAGVDAKILVDYKEYMHLKQLQEQMHPSNEDDEADDDNVAGEEGLDTLTQDTASTAQSNPSSAHSLAQLKHTHELLSSENQRLQELDLERQREKQTLASQHHMYAPYTRGAGRGRGARRGGRVKKTAFPSTSGSKLYYIG